jgi:hypothetical protein
MCFAQLVTTWNVKCGVMYRYESKNWYATLLWTIQKLERINGNKRKNGSGRACWKGSY